MKLCIDNRERDRIPKFQNYIKSGKTKYIDGVETGNYPVSDYHTKDLLVGIEYKRNDLVESTFNGQLEKQIKELRDNFEYPYLFVGYDGISEMMMENLGVNPETLVGELSSILGRYKVPWTFVGDLLVPITCKVAERFYDGKTKIKEAEYTSLRMKIKKKKVTPTEIKRVMLQRIPNFGPRKVDNVLKHFDNSLGNISRASVEEIMEIKGIGDKLAKDIKEILE